MSGKELVREIENQKADNNHKPYADIRIMNCGELIKKSMLQKRKEGETLCLL